MATPRSSMTPTPTPMRYEYAQPTPQTIHRRATACAPLVLDAARAVQQQLTGQQPLRRLGQRRRHSESGSVTNYNNNSSNVSNTSISGNTTPLQETAAYMAREAPHAGYLQKLGANVSAFKRRFFVLVPGTHLWYFLNANDTEPRGCLDLQGSTVQDLGGPHMPEGTYRFAIHWNNQNKHASVILEAPTQEAHKAWMQHIQSSRFEYVKEECQRQRAELSQAHAKTKRLERQLEQYKHVEQEKIQAVEDATQWKQSFELLDESLRVITQHLLTSETTTDDEDQHPTTTACVHQLQVPGTKYLLPLINATQQLQHNCKLAADEAASAVQDLSKTQIEQETLQRRMDKAEKHMVQLWQENCTVRKSLKQIKREKRLLVREVKTMMAASQAPHEDTVDEDQLLNELEEHVNSCMQLHEQFMAKNGKLGNATRKHERSPADNRKDEKQTTSDTMVPSTARNNDLRRKPLTSLFDDESDDSSVDDGEDDVQSNSLSAVSSTVAETSQQSESPERPNPLLHLDHDDDDELDAFTHLQQPRLEQATAPTAVLSCPLEDVHSTTQNTAPEGDGQVYHLTFYSRKIGLQFQKVPPPPERPRGLLTDALMSDVEDTSRSLHNNTTNELRRIANLHSFVNKTSADRSDPDVLQVATPVDAVLVCGFHGFDDTGSNVRPRLGARLVAFDGVSVEIGKWTFDGIRKAIQARGRPLTLSFRNDFLTTEQRKVLTKAVQEIGLPGSPKPLSPDEISHESGSFINDTVATTLFSQDTDSSSVGGYAPPLSFSGSRSVNSRGSGSQYRSFSEAGSSLSNSVGPFVTGLLHKHPMTSTPNYLRRAPESVEDTPQHQDFRSELL